MPTAMAPATPEPIMEAGMKRTGSAAAKGSTPSVMKHRPMGNAVIAVSRSVWVNLLRAMSEATKAPTGGVMPPMILADIGP